MNGWGATNYGQITPPPNASNVLAIAAGGNDSLALVPDPFAPPIPPRIARPPLGRSLQTGANVVFNALAVGGLPLRYQWYRDGVALAGKTNQWLSLNNVQPGQMGNYQVVALNDFGTSTSAVASVSVNIPQPLLQSLSRTVSGFSFNLQTTTGVQYRSEYENTLAPGAWVEFDNRIGNGGTETVTDTNAVSQTRFYRVRAVYPPAP